MPQSPAKTLLEALKQRFGDEYPAAIFDPILRQ
jgi:hypothetical protein